EWNAIRAPPAGIGKAEPDHGELRSSEGEQHAEAEEAGEEEDGMRERGGAGEERDRDRRGRGGRLGRDKRALQQHFDLPWQLSVLAERVGEPAEAGDRRRRGGEQDQRTG